MEVARTFLADYDPDRRPDSTLCCLPLRRCAGRWLWRTLTLHSRVSSQSTVALWVSVCVCVLPHVSVCVCVCVCVLYSRCGRAEDSLGPGESVRIIWVELIRQVSLSYFFSLFFHPHIIFLKLSVSALRNFFFSKNHPAVWDSCLLMWCNSENIQLSTEKSPENKVSSTNCFFFFFFVRYSVLLQTLRFNST